MGAAVNAGSAWNQILSQIFATARLDLCALAWRNRRHGQCQCLHSTGYGVISPGASIDGPAHVKKLILMGILYSQKVW